MGQTSLLLGCGNDRRKKVHLEGQAEWTGRLVRVDMNPHCEPDLVLDLEKHPLPFPDNEFDELAAYDVLEHLGRQGDWKGYFQEFAEYHRILKPGGIFGIIVPINDDALADPGHTRFFGRNHFAFLNQKWYADCLAAGICVTDYRWFWKLNFDVLYLENCHDHHLAAILRKA